MSGANLIIWWGKYRAYPTGKKYQYVITIVSCLYHGGWMIEWWSTGISQLWQLAALLKGNFTDFLHKGQFTLHAEYYLACGISCIVSSEDPEMLYTVWENNPDNVIGVIPAWVWKQKNCNKKSALQTGGMQFELCGHLPSTGSQTNDVLWEM